MFFLKKNIIEHNYTTKPLYYNITILYYLLGLSLTKFLLRNFRRNCLNHMELIVTSRRIANLMPHH